MTETGDPTREETIPEFFARTGADSFLNVSGNVETRTERQADGSLKTVVGPAQGTTTG